MSKVIKVDETIVTNIEKLQYEVESRKDVIVALLSTTFTVDNARFEAYQNEYREYFTRYNQAKHDMLIKYGVPSNVNWNLDFASRELTVG